MGMLQVVSTRIADDALRAGLKRSAARKFPAQPRPLFHGGPVQREAVPFYRRWFNLLKPALTLKRLADLTPAELRRMGTFKAVLFDLDDTLIPMRKGQLSTAMVERLKALQSAGYRLGVVSNNVQTKYCQQAQANLKKLGLDLPFVRNARKPGQQGYRMMLNQMGVKPHEAVMVGDSLLGDVLGGNRMGMKTIRAKWYTGSGILNWRVMRYLREMLDGLFTSVRRMFSRTRKPLWVQA